MPMLLKKIGKSKYSHFIAKDFLDLKRSEGGLGKLVFSFAIPLALVSYMVLFFSKFISQINFYLVFSIFLGVVSSTVYNWLTEFDLFNAYSFLPVRVSDVIKSKIEGYTIINIVSVAILVLATIWTENYANFFPALFTFIGVSYFALGVNIYLAGLTPNLLLYNPKILAKYLALLTPVLLILCFASVINPTYMLFSR